MSLRGCLIVCCAASLVGCKIYDSYQQVSKQTPTFANLQAFSSMVTQDFQNEECITVEDLKELAKPYNNASDEWGHPFLFAVKASNIGNGTFKNCSYVALSTGADGVLDVEKVEEYFVSELEDVTGKFDRDIVFRDGTPLKFGSNK